MAPGTCPFHRVLGYAHPVKQNQVARRKEQHVHPSNPFQKLMSLQNVLVQLNLQREDSGDFRFHLNSPRVFLKCPCLNLVITIYGHPAMSPMC